MARSIRLWFAVWALVMLASVAHAAPPQPVYVTGSTPVTNDCVKFSGPVSVTDTGGSCIGGNPITIGSDTIGAATVVPPVTTICDSTAGEGSLCLRSDVASLYQMWLPTASIPTRVQEADAYNSFAVTLGSTPTPGHYLIAFGHSATVLPAAGSGWTSFGTHNAVSSDPYARVAYHLVQSGDGTSWTPFTTTDSRCYGDTVIEVSNLDMVNFSNALQSLTWGQQAFNASPSLTVSATTTTTNTLAVAEAGTLRDNCVSLSGLVASSSLNAGWTHTVSSAGTVIEGSQFFASNSSSVTDTVTSSSVSNASTTGALIIFQNTSGTQTSGWQQLSSLTVVKNGGTTITNNARTLNFSTGMSATDDGQGNETITAGQGANTIPIASLAQIGADTYLGNETGSTANVTAVSWPSCSGASNAITYNTSTHTIGCNSLASGVGVSGTPAANDCAKWLNSTTIEDSGGTCGGGGSATIVAPQGRLTLVSATPVLTADETAKSTVYYDCYAGNNVPYYNGASDALDTISSCEVSMTMQTSSTGVTNSAGVFDVWWVHGGTNRICVATNGSGGGWASDTGGSNTARGTGYSQVHNTRGYWTNVNSITHCYNGTTDYGSVSADQATYLGTLYTTAAGQTGMAFKPSCAAGGTNNVLGLFNAYNTVLVVARSCDATSGNPGYTTTTTTWHAANNGATGSGLNNRISYVDGLGIVSIDGTIQNGLATSSTSDVTETGCVEDGTGAPDAAALYNGTGVISFAVAKCVYRPTIGFHYIQAVEIQNTGGTGSFWPDFSSQQNEQLSVAARM